MMLQASHRRHARRNTSETQATREEQPKEHDDEHGAATKTTTKATAYSRWGNFKLNLGERWTVRNYAT